MRALVLAVLAGAGLATFARVHDLALHRHFTIDEWQYGHATWLVSQGELPYRDFYEHHVPLSYVVHAPLLGGEAPFSERALRMRRIVFGWMAATATLLLAATLAATREPAWGLLAAFVPFGFGFGLLSAVDYRADNFSAFLTVAALALLWANRRPARRAPSLAAGVLLGSALWTTQKAATVVGGLALVFGLLEVLSRRRKNPSWISAPLPLLAGLVATGAVGLGGLAVAGVLPEAFEITVLHALAHEGAHPPVSVSRFLLPFLAETPASTAALVASALLGVASRHGRFWWVPLGVALATSGLLRAQFPYNFVLAGLLLVLTALAGFAWLVERVPLPQRLATWRPYLWLLPLLVLPDQLGFVRGVSDNRHQLALLDAVERFTGPEDVVIDGAGGALFRPHASYWWYHGGAHRQILAEVFSQRLLEDYRASAAPLWIRDLRMRGLPLAVHDYFRRHYLRVDGDLFALGFGIPATGGTPTTLPIDVVRAGRWRAFARDGGATDRISVRVDGRPLEGGIDLAVGEHLLEVAAGSPALVFTPLPEALFRETRIAPGQHSPTFEYERR